MRKLLAALALAGSLSGCISVSLNPKDRERVDKFLVEVERFNNNVEALKTLIAPEKPKKLVAKTSNE